MLAQVYWNLPVVHTAPAEWTEIVSFDLGSIYSRTAGASEPADYTWEWVSGGLGSNASRGGTMITIENADTTLGNIDSADNQLTVPDVEATETGSMLVAFNGGPTTTWVSSDPDFWIADSPLTMQGQHHGIGTHSYESPFAQCVATEEDLTVGTISGRTFSTDSTSGGTRIAAVVVNPA